MAYVDICIQDHEVCPNERPIISATQDTVSSTQVRIRREDNTPYDLSCCQVLFQSKDAYWNNLFYIRKDVVVVDALNGIVRIDLTAAELCNTGLYLAELVVHREATSSSSAGCPAVDELELLFRTPMYLEVAPSLDTTSPIPQGISIAEVRLAIRDKCAEDNFLLDTTEFTATEIAWAIRRPVEYWNEALPPLNIRYTPATFPYRYNWFDAIIGELLVIASHNYTRNNLSYAAGNVSVNDKDKGPVYMQTGMGLRENYKKWVRMQKMSINAGMAMGSTSINSFGDGRVTSDDIYWN